MWQRNKSISEHNELYGVICNPSLVIRTTQVDDDGRRLPLSNKLALRIIEMFSLIGLIQEIEMNDECNDDN